MSGYITKLLFNAPSCLAKIDERGFSCSDPKIQDHLERIGAIFLLGFNHTLISQDAGYLINKFRTTSSDYLGFAYEGVGMGLALLENLPFNNQDRLRDFIETSGEKHRYMLHVGAGWALAKLPLNLEKAIKKYDSLLRWLVVDGYGFHQAYFKTNKYVYQTVLPANLSPFAKHVFYQGVGRCLWFVEGAQPSRIFWRINIFPEEYHSDLWAGVGLASTYAGGVGKEAITELIKLSKAYTLELAQGSCFAAKAREYAGNPTSHTEMACQLICGLSTADAARVTDECSLDLPLNNSEIAYALWQSKIRNVVKEYSHKSLVE